ncbi:MAG: hypothetical protein ACKVOJ_13770 [Sphingomonadaceae bacterium]
MGNILVMIEISSRKDLKQWLEDQPKDWAQIIAVRAAMRALPFLGQADGKWLIRFCLLPIRANAISWAARNFPAHDMGSAADAAYAAAANDAAYAAANAAAYAAADAAYAAAAADAAYAASGAYASAFWRAVSLDCEWLSKQDHGDGTARVMTRRSLWLAQPPNGWKADWQKLAATLIEIDPNYQVWIDWFDRRISGEPSAFDIPGDKGRIEDKKILIRLADATHKDFWGKGHEYVNATLKGWIDEARARVAPPPPEDETEIPVPPQAEGAITYGVSDEGKVDRLQPSDQVHLRDVPDQRRSYADLREAVIDLLEEGQRLGPRLTRALERFMQSLPERFEDAEAYLVWRDGNALRRLYRAHRLVADGKEPDPARLEAVAAEGLGGVLDLFNPFAFADEGIRAKDEQRISAQEQADARVEAAAAAPLIPAILAAPEIATPDALDDIKADTENADLPANDPYAAQVEDQANRTKRNWIAGLLEGARRAIRNPKLIGGQMVGGAAKTVGVVTAASIMGSNYGPLLEFVAVNASILQTYVGIAFSTYPDLPGLIERIKLFVAERWRL